MTSILSNWHFMRILRAVLAVWLIKEGFQSGETMLYFLAGIFAMQAIFDIGCCGAAGCAAPAPTRKQTTGNTEEEVAFEEVK